jgi:hypothetical protein
VQVADWASGFLLTKLLTSFLSFTLRELDPEEKLLRVLLLEVKSLSSSIGAN